MPRIQSPYHRHPQVPTVSLRAMFHCSKLSQPIAPMMRPNELPQNPISINTLSEMMTATSSVSAERPLTVDVCLRCATNQDNAHQRHTRSVQSSSTGGSFSQALNSKTQRTSELYLVIIVASSPSSCTSALPSRRSRAQWSKPTLARPTLALWLK